MGNVAVGGFLAWLFGIGSFVCSASGCDRRAGKSESAVSPSAESGAPLPVGHREKPDPLAATQRVGCIDASQLVATFTPADLYPGVAECISQSRMHEAAILFGLAGAYGRYDVARVADQSAHQAINLLRLKHVDSRPRPEQDQLMAEMKRISGDPTTLAAYCREIVRLGRPSYHPNYMIQHGLGDFGETQATPDGLVVGFDPARAWTKVLDEYLHCKIPPR